MKQSDLLILCPPLLFLLANPARYRKRTKGPNRKEEEEKNIVLNIRIYQIYFEKT